MHTVDLHDPRIMRGKPKDMTAVVKMAAKFGWTGSITSAGGLRLHSPIDGTVVRVPNSTRTDPTQARRNATMVVRHSDPELVRGYTERMGDVTEQALMTDEMPDTETMDDLEALAAAIENRPGAAFGTPLNQIHVTLLSETPWLAKKGQTKAGGQRYESESVLERVWSDGTKDYVCPTCRTQGVEPPYVSDSPRSVAIHNAGHTRRGEKKALDLRAREVILVTPGDDTVHRDESRVERLAKEILAATRQLDREEFDAVGPEQWAHNLASKIIEARGDRQEPVPVEPAPVTPEGLLAQIRALVSADLVQQRVAMEATITTQAEALAAANETLLRAQNEARKAKDTLAAFAAMAREATEEVDDDGSGDRQTGTPAPSAG